MARKMFKLRVHEAKGLIYQTLFERVMGYAFKGFTPVRPYGRVGDRKNDGYIPSEGRFFQVFAPADPSVKRSLLAAARKAAQDFAGLKASWNKETPIRDYRFAFNDEYTGSPPPLEDALAKIRIDHGIEARSFLAKDLEEIALSLPEDQLLDVIATHIPEVGLFDSVDFTILREVILHILDKAIPYTPTTLPKPPDFSQKIAFNGLSAACAALLMVGSYQTDAIKDYFAKNSTYARQDLRDRLNAMYLESRARFVALGYSSAEQGDLVFFHLLNLLTPLQTLPRQQKAAQEATIVVMAFYFEACDIFEDPNAPS